MTHKTAYENGQFCWVDLASHGASSARKFYAEVFDWTTATVDTGGGPRYAYFQQGAHTIAGLGELDREMRDHGVPPLWNSYINVVDIEAVLARVPELGGTILVPAMRALDAGSLAFITDPTGAHVGLWQADRHVGATVVNEPATLCWNELATRDLDAAKNFYGPLFGWEFADHKHSPTQYYVIQNRGQLNGGLLQMTPEYGDLPPHWMVYFATADTDATVAKVEAAGGQVHIAPFDTAVGRIAVVSDAQGAAFSLIQIAAADGSLSS